MKHLIAIVLLLTGIGGFCQEPAHQQHPAGSKDPSQTIADCCAQDTDGQKTDHAAHKPAATNHPDGHAMTDGKHQMGDMNHAEMKEHVHPTATEEEKKLVGVDEKLDTSIPMDLVFRLEDGTVRPLKDIIRHPTLIVPIYFNCPNVCHMLQSAVAAVLPRVKMKPGEEYQVLSVSFDETDTPDIARQKKANYMAAMNHQFPQDAWHFLTTDKDTVDTFMDAIGFRYQRKGKDFIHPVVVVAVTPEGKISRYIYGSSFLPFDITLALTEASAGRSGLSVKRLVSYCFSYDPKGKKYVFRMTRVVGSVILIFAVFIFLMLVFGGRRKRRQTKG